MIEFILDLVKMGCVFSVIFVIVLIWVTRKRPVIADPDWVM